MHRAIFPGDNNYDKILAKEFDRIIPYARLYFCVPAFPVSNAFFSSDMTAELCYEVAVRFLCLVFIVFNCKLKISAIQLTA